MVRLYQSYIQLCLFRGSVQTTNASDPALLAVCVVFALTSLTLYTVSPELQDLTNYYARTLVIFLAFNVLIFLALVYRKNVNRYRKVLSAFLGTRTLVDLCLVFIAVLFTSSEEMRLLLSVIVSLWRMCIVGYILRAGLDVSLPGGILIAIGFTILSILIADATIGDSLAPELIPSGE